MANTPGLMGGMFDSVFDRVGQTFPLTAIELDPEIARPKSLLKLLDATHYNWKADRFRKLFGMRFKVKLPPLNQLNCILYPEPVYDTPIFLFFVLLTKRKMIAHLNVYCPFDDEPYLQKHVEPLNKILNTYPPFDCDDRYPEWMQKFRQPCSIYGMFPRDRVDDIGKCAHDYLDHYLQQAAAAEPVTDPARLEQIKVFHEQFISDIRTQDKAQGMMAKMIGKDKARRIFYEITT
ncbi:MAG: phytochromobilin:ferredoxin oxidoreductase [Gammaproteobacteria bacterium]|nr:phytochromobilin:ferredoxin oxidoreductase [Gammaproteobacteria bacterium]